MLRAILIDSTSSVDSCQNHQEDEGAVSSGIQNQIEETVRLWNALCVRPVLVKSFLDVPRRTFDTGLDVRPERTSETLRTSDERPVLVETDTHGNSIKGVVLNIVRVEHLTIRSRSVSEKNTERVSSSGRIQGRI